MLNIFSDHKEDFLLQMKRGNNFFIPENPYKEAVFNRTPNQIKLNDLTNYIEFELRIIRALPDTPRCSGVILNKKGESISTVIILMPHGKADKIKKIVDYYNSIKTLCINHRKN